MQVVAHPGSRAVPPTVARAQRGDLAAFEELYRQHAGRIHALSLRICGDPSLAEDLTQDVFVRAWQKLDTFQGDAAFGTWLHRLAVNLLLTDRRSTARRLARVEPVADVDGAVPARPAGAGLDLERALRTLPERAREVFVLHEVEGLEHEEIAEVMGTSVGTAKSQLHRARDLLRRFLR